jgi:hypothetical protein
MTNKRNPIWIVLFYERPVAAFTDLPELVDWLRALPHNGYPTTPTSITKVLEGGELGPQPVFTYVGFLDRFAS